jgi:hypothetical protein
VVAAAIGSGQRRPGKRLSRWRQLSAAMANLAGVGGEIG